MPIVVGGTSYYIESLLYHNLVHTNDDNNDDVDDNNDDVDDDDDDDGDNDEQRPSLTESTSTETLDARMAWTRTIKEAKLTKRPEQQQDLSAEAFRRFAMFRNRNDVPTPTTAAAACRCYADTLTEAERFAREMVAAAGLSMRRYANTFVDYADAERRWPRDLVQCELAALYAHGVRTMDAVCDEATHNEPLACKDDGHGTSRWPPKYQVRAADVTTGLEQRYGRSDVDARIASLQRQLAVVGNEATAVDRLGRTRAELQRRVERLMLALLVEQERLALDLIASPGTLKMHALYYDPVGANALHPHNTRKVFR